MTILGTLERKIQMPVRLVDTFLATQLKPVPKFNKTVSGMAGRPRILTLDLTRNDKKNKKAERKVKFTSPSQDPIF